MVYFFVFFAGLLLLFFPSIWWLISHGFASNGDEEPSDLFILNARIGGTICTLIGLLGILTLIFG